MGTTDRLEMLVNLDDSQARTQVAGLERRGLRMPLGLEGGSAGGKPGGARGIPGVPGAGRAGAAGRIFTGGYGAAGMIMGGGILASQLLQEFQRPGGMSLGRIIATGAMTVGGALMSTGNPYAMAAGAILSVGSLIYQSWKSSKSTEPRSDFDLGAIRDRFKKDVAIPPPEETHGDEDVIMDMSRIGDGVGFGNAASAAQGGFTLLAAQAQEDILAELQSIRKGINRLILQGTA